MRGQITKRQKQLLEVIYDFIKNSGYPPTFEEMRGNLEVSSNQSIVDLLQKLKNGGYIKRDEGARSIAILPLGYKTLDRPPLVAFAGVASAGPSIEMIEMSGEWQTISADVAKFADQVSLFKVFGDSMINAGIDDGDVVLVKDQHEFVSGDIVLARLNGSESTVKRFISEDKPPYVYLKPENPKYSLIPFTDEMQLIGKIISLLNGSDWRPVK